MFNAKWFFDLEQTIINMGFDSDQNSFAFIKKNLDYPKVLNKDEFFEAVSYVILASGFSQTTAKKKHKEIIEYLTKNKSIDISELLKIFNNKNKISAIIKIYLNRDKFCTDYYLIKNLEDKLKYLQKLPHIGKITANHLARNLGENIVKYDIWIQRLGLKFINNNTIVPNNKILNNEIKEAVDKMFLCLEKETHLKRGYIDVVLWKACQKGLIKF